MKNRNVLTPLLRLRSDPWLTLAAGLCALFTVCLAFNVQAAYDGSWFFYAQLMDHGRRLYTDLHFSQQPFYVLETLYWNRLTHANWMLSRVPAIFQGLLLCGGLTFIASKTRWGPVAKGILLLSSFFIAIRFEAYRFDDYHVVADACMVCTVSLLLVLPDIAAKRSYLLKLAFCGGFCAIDLLTRLNDGLALTAFTALFILVRTKKEKFAALCAAGCGFLLVAASILLMLGDSPQAWLENSILHVSSLKGGSSHVLADPVLLPVYALQYIVANMTSYLAGGTLSFLVLVGTVTASAFAFRRAPAKRTLAILAATATLCTIELAQVCTAIFDGTLVIGWLAAVVPFCYATAIYAVAQKFRENTVFLILPFLLFCDASLSSGGHFEDLFTPAAVEILTCAMVFRLELQYAVRCGMVAVFSVLGLSAAIYRIHNPFSWINLSVPPLFENRRVFDHPLYGPMVIDNAVYAQVSEICDRIGPVHPGDTLLAIPFPYANYFCGIPLWHEVVTTWYDIANPQLIDSAARGLAAGPPEWVVYYRELNVLHAHEGAFNGGKPLPQEAFDRLILSRLADGDWTIADLQLLAPDRTLMLIHTKRQSAHAVDVLSQPYSPRRDQAWSVHAALHWKSTKYGFRLISVPDELEESILAAPLRFPHKGKVTVTALLKAEDVNASTGYGFGIDLYDETRDAVVASEFRRARRVAGERIKLTADVRGGDLYRIRLRYDAQGGTVDYRLPDVSYQHGTRMQKYHVRWPYLDRPTNWAVQDGKRFSVTVKHAATVADESYISRNVRFSRTGMVVFGVKAHIQNRDAIVGNAFTLQLVDPEGTMACFTAISPPSSSRTQQLHSFCRVRAGQTYSARIFARQMRADVRFDRPRISYVEK